MKETMISFSSRKDHLIVDVFRTRPVTDQDGTKHEERCYLIGPLPAIPFEIVHLFATQ